MTLSPLREAIAFTRWRREQALKALQDTGARLRDTRQQLSAAESINPDSQEAVQLRAAVAQLEGSDLPAAQATVDGLTQQLAADRGAYDSAAATEPPVWAADGSLPVLLLPVRVEAVYRENATQLWVRIYPDDVHVDGFEPELTDAERLAGSAYWRALWASGTGADGQPRREQAWRTLTAAAGRTRAPWVAAQLRPAGDPPEAATPEGQPAPDPGPFPDPPRREKAWNRAAHSRLLPDLFVVSGYRHGALAWRVEGQPIADVLPVSFAPPGTGAAAAGDLPWDDASRWLVDFDAAVAVGMGVRVPLPDDDPQFDVVTVVGVMREIDATEGAARVQQMLVAHRFGDGLAVLPAGTPTTNTPATRSAWRSLADPNPPDVDQARRAQYDAASAQPAARLARALGVDGVPVLATLDAGIEDDEPTVAALQALVGQMLAWSSDWRQPNATSVLVTGTQPLADHFREHLRSRGPLPTLRIGRQPYGVLPATALDLWRGGDVDVQIVDTLSSFFTYFDEQAIGARSIRSGDDPDAALLDVLSRRASSASVRLAHDGGGPPPASAPVGAVPWDSTFAKRGLPRYPTPPLAVCDPAPAQLRDVAAHAPVQQCATLIADMRAFFDAWDWTQGQPPDDATEQLRSRFQELEAAMKPFEGADAVGVFYPMLVPVAEVALLCTFVLAQAAHLGDAESPDVRAMRLGLSHVVAAVQAAAAIEARAAGDFGHVERLLCETLDLTAHRLDAWITSLATARLSRLRRGAPSGVHVGAYGWLTDLAPVDAADRRALDGYVIAPSMHHATTAAVLRSGYLAHADKQAFAVNLTSRRVRLAMALLDGVRSGQRLPALLGYQLERALHDANLDQHIAALRTRYPLAPLVDLGADDAAEARQAVAARSVVDGDAVRRDRSALTGPQPPVDLGNDRDRILSMVADLDDAVDALGDVLLAESVHHLVGGNPLRAGATIDALGGGDWLPPDLEVVATPRSVTLLPFAVGAFVPPGDVPEWAPARPIAALEPGLERLARTWLGPPDGWTFGLQDGGALSMPDAGWCALEVLLGTGPEPRPAASPLLRRMLRSRPATALTPEGAARYAELAQLCAAWRGVLAAATPLLPSHLAPGEAGWGAVDVDELRGRVEPWLAAVEAARSALRAARTTLTADAAAAVPALVEALDQLASCGVRGTVCEGPPTSDQARQALVAQVDGTLDLLAATLGTPMPALPTELTAAAVHAWVGAAADRVRSIAGDALVLLPRVELGGAAARVDPANRPAGSDDGAVADWLREVGRVRPRAGALADALVGSEVLAGTPAAEWQVTQSPATPGQPWIATSRAPDDGPLSRAPASCVLAGSAPTGATACGFVADSWSEALPRAPRPDCPPEEVAAIAFHIDRPDARAPQAALLAVPPDDTRGWNLEDLHAVVLDTLTLARIRTLDLVDLPDLRAIVPPTWFGD